MKKNPFTLMFGIASDSIVPREDNIGKIISTFTEQRNMLAYLITGIRGSGKTVLLRSVEKRLLKDNGWVVVNINPQGEIIESLASKLSDLAVMHKIVGKIGVSINLGVVTITRESGDKTTDPEIVVENMMQTFKDANINVLISIDEVNDTHEFRKFINFYQTMISKNLPAYLLMTALPENVNTLINDKAMTFLSRLPKIELEPLSLANIALNYSEIFNNGTDQAIKMAKLTNGYAFAYQVLGYLMFENGKKEIDDEIIRQYDKHLWSNGYNKFWNDITDVERKFLIALAISDGKKESIINNGFPDNSYSQYRRRLLEKGLINMPRQGELNFILPRFREYVLFIKEFE